MAVQWLRLPMHGVWVQSLVEELRSDIPGSQKTKTEKRSSIVTNLVKTLKMAHIKKKILKEKGKQTKISINILTYISTSGVSWVHLCVLE